jgi:hypothetical protein
MNHSLFQLELSVHNHVVRVHPTPPVNFTSAKTLLQFSILPNSKTYVPSCDDGSTMKVGILAADLK